MTASYRSFDDVPMRAAVRFPLRLQITVSTAERDYLAVTEDVSAYGLLFLGDELPPVGSEVKFKLTMPAAVMGGVDDVVLHCVGRIVRQQVTAGGTVAAAVIDEYSLKAESL